jgi:very-short-patch-repair endonuclease
LFCHDAALIIELDGGQHGTARTTRYDAGRTAWLATRGYRVLRFWNNDVLQNTSGVLEVIAAELHKTPPSLIAATRRSDLPRKGGGEEQVAR